MHRRANAQLLTGEARRQRKMGLRDRLTIEPEWCSWVAAFLVIALAGAPPGLLVLTPKAVVAFCVLVLVIVVVVAPLAPLVAWAVHRRL